MMLTIISKKIYKQCLHHVNPRPLGHEMPSKRCRVCLYGQYH